MDRRFSPEALTAAATPELRLARHGHFWTGLSSHDDMSGAMYVEFWIPAELRHSHPLVLIHGGGGQGLDFLGSAEIGEGWVHWFVREGYAVYVVDRPQHGRAGSGSAAMAQPGLDDFLERLFTAPETVAENYPRAAQHTPWPGGGRKGEAGFRSFVATGFPPVRDIARHHEDCVGAGTELLHEIGPAILLTHSAGAPVGWSIADANPSLVVGVVAVEPYGPPFTEGPAGALTDGVTVLPLQRDTDGSAAALRGRPIAVVSAEASWAQEGDAATVAYLTNAGCTAEHVLLGDHGVHGNGHMMMLEHNRGEVAAVIERWLRTNGLG